MRICFQQMVGLYSITVLNDQCALSNLLYSPIEKRTKLILYGRRILILLPISIRVDQGTTSSGEHLGCIFPLAVISSLSLYERR